MKKARFNTGTREIAKTVKNYLEEYYPEQVKIIEENHEPEINPFGDEGNFVDVSIEVPYDISPYDAVKIGEIIGSMKVKKEVDETGTYTV